MMFLRDLSFIGEIRLYFSPNGGFVDAKLFGKRVDGLALNDYAPLNLDPLIR